MVTRVAVAAGDSVKKGDLLVELDKSELESQINEASFQIEASQLHAEKMKLDLGREQQLIDAKLVSQKEFDDLKIDAQLAENQLEIDSAHAETLRQQLAKTTILAPRSGTVLKIDVLEGTVIIGAGSVSTGTSLMTVADLSQLEVDADVDEIDVAQLQVGMPVHLSLDSIPDLKLEGKIKFISPLAVARGDKAQTDDSIHVFPIVVTLDTTDPRVKVGLTANLAIPLSHVERALSLPLSMVFEDENTSFVYLRSNGTITRKNIKVGINDAEYVEIKSGLNEGDEVSLNPAPDQDAKKL
jgi:HlyD family secretion protein